MACSFSDDDITIIVKHERDRDAIPVHHALPAEARPWWPFPPNLAEYAAVTPGDDEPPGGEELVDGPELQAFPRADEGGVRSG